MLKLVIYGGLREMETGSERKHQRKSQMGVLEVVTIVADHIHAGRDFLRGNLLLSATLKSEYSSSDILSAAADGVSF